MATPGPAGFEHVDLSELGFGPDGSRVAPVHQDPPIVDPQATVADPEPEPEPESAPESTPAEPEVPPTSEPEAEPAPPEPVGDDTEVELPDGSKIPLGRLRELAQLDATFKSSPDIQRRVIEAVRPQPDLAQRRVETQPEPEAVSPPVPSAPVAVTPPPDLDLDDPIGRFVWTQHQAQQAELARIGQLIEQQNQYQQQSARQQAEVGLQAARNNVAQRFGLNPDELAQVEQTAGRVANLQGLLTEEGGSYERAAVRAMETAIASDPQLRSRLITPPPESATDRTRRQNLTALAGSSASAPRTEPTKPLGKEERVAAMAAEIRNAAQGQSV